MTQSWRTRRFIFVALLILLAVASVWAQVITGKITGMVHDPSGASIVGATLRAMNVSTGTADSIASDASGNFQFFALQPGMYTLEVTMQGFKTFRREGLVVEADRSLAVPVSLDLGQATEVVEVREGTVLLDANTSSLGTSVDNSRILNMPVNGRNPMALALLVPTVKGVGDFGKDLGQQSWMQAAVTIGGGNALANGNLLDGVANDKFGDSAGSVGFLGAENVQELKIITNAMAAEYGNTGGGIISVISRSGTNQYKGTLYEYLRNNAMNSRDFFSAAAGAPNPPNKTHQFGGTYGGPIIRNKLFFQGNFERAISRTGSAIQVNYAPSAAERKGDFSQTLGPNGQPILMYDPLTTVTGANGTPTRTPFPGNSIPANRVSLASQVILGMYPEANQPGLPFTHANNLYQAGNSTFDRDDLSAKIDYNMTDKQRLALRYGWGTNDILGANYFGAGHLLSNNGGLVKNPRQSASLQYSNALSATMILEARIGVNSDGEQTASPSTQQGGYDITKVGLPASLAPQLQTTSAAPNGAIPCFNVSDLVFPHPILVGGLGMGTCNGNKKRTGLTWANSVNLTKVLNVHTFKFGWERRFAAFYPSTLDAPTFNFTRGFTQGPNPNVTNPNAGFGLASFLLGYPASGSINYGAIQAYSSKYHALFAQDDWKVTRRLTLNLGLRWDYNAPTVERFNQLSMFDPSIPLPVQVPGMTLKGGLTFPGVGDRPRGLTEPNRDHFGPRFGFAYQVNSKYVVRGGYGIIYTPFKGVTFAATGYSRATNMITSLDNGLRPYNTLANPFPEGVLLPTGNSLGALTGIGQSVSGQVRDANIGYSQQWNLTQQFQPLPNWLIEVAYLGNKGTHLLSSGTNLNQLNPVYNSLGNALNQTVPNPFFGVAPAGTQLAAATVTRQQLLLPYPQFTGVNGGYSNQGDSIYHALTLKVDKRFSNGLSFSASYAYGKLIDAGVLGAGRTNGTSDSGIVNWYNLAAERSENVNSIRHRVVGSALWQLPIFRQSTGFVKAALGGWQLNVLPTLESGRGIALTSATGGRPNVVAGQEVGLDNPTIGKWFNTSAYSIPQPFTFGNSSRTIPGVFSDGIINFDASLFKDFPIREKISLQFRAESFNAMNHVTFDTPGRAIGNSQFGVVAAQAPNPGPRRMQLGMRLSF